MVEGVRLQKYLARAGVASRRASETLIAEGRVRVDGQVVREPGTRVDPEASVVEVDGRRVRPRPPEWVALHKPPGCLCTRRDPQGRPTVYSLLPAGLHHLFHVGRLDYMSEGLLLLTNVGGAAHRLLHPSAGTTKEYEVTVAEPVPEDVVERLLAGVEIGDGPARVESAAVDRVGGGECRLRLTLREGRNREIRRLMEALGLEVHRLCRVAIGPLRLGDLPPGAWRRLEAGEVDRLLGRGGGGRGRGLEREAAWT